MRMTLVYDGRVLEGMFTMAAAAAAAALEIP